MKVLGWLAYVLRWAEELLIIVSGPLLTFGLGIALVDLLTDGALLTTQPGLLYAWAGALAGGTDAQLVGSSAKLARAWHEGRWWAVVGYAILIVPLAYVAFLASNVFATQQADGISTAEALARLGMDGTTWILQRSALAVLLVILSGLLRYVPDKATDAADERATLEREAELEPLRQRVRAARALGMVGLGRQIVAAATGHDVVTPTPTPTPAEESPVRTQDMAPVRTQADGEGGGDDETPPTGPGTPGRKPSGRTPRPDEREAAAIIELAVPPEWRERAARGQRKASGRTPARKQRRNVRRVPVANYEPMAREAFADGARSVAKMERATGMGHAAASSWVRTLKAEAAAQAQAQQVRQVAQ